MFIPVPIRSKPTEIPERTCPTTGAALATPTTIPPTPATVWNAPRAEVSLAPFAVVIIPAPSCNRPRIAVPFETAAAPLKRLSSVAGGPAFRIFLSRSGTVGAVGAPSLRSLQGRAAMLPVRCSLSCRAACTALTAPIPCTLSPVRATDDCPTPALRKVREGRGTHGVGDVGEIKSLGHPPKDPSKVTEHRVLNRHF